MPRLRIRGFTLLEVMIVVVIVAILADIALPAYQSQVRKSRRAAAEAHLMDIAARQQTYLMDKRDAYAADVATLGIATPSDVASFYTITITPAGGPPPTFTATAAATGDQVNDLGSGVNLTIDNAGNKAPAGKW